MSFVASHSSHAGRRSRRVVCVIVGLLASAAAASAPAQEWQAAIRAGDYPAAQRALESALLAQPEDASLRYELARVLGLAGSAEAALAEFDTLLERYPDNADYLLGRAQMLARLGRDAAALETTRQTLRVAPDYEDAWQLRLTLVERVGDAAVAAALRQESAARFPDASWWRRPPPPEEYTRWLSVGLGGDRLSNGAPEWIRESVRLDWQTSPRAALYGEIARAERFSRTDSALAVGGVWQALPQWRIGGGFGAAADADFEPTRELTLDAHRPWPDGWGTELGYRRREYAGAAVASYSVTGEKYLSDYRIAYRLDYSRLLGAASSVGHSVILGWYPSERRSLGITAGAGEEIETIGLGQLLRTDVSSLTLTGRETLSTRFQLSWWLGTHRQGDFYRRRYGGLSVRIGI